MVMYHYNYEGLVREQQKKIEKSSFNAWKYQGFNKDSKLNKIMKHLPLIRRSMIKDNQTNCICITEC